MARLIYSQLCSLDGYTADEQGRFDWAAPDAEVHAFVNDQERAVGTYLYGRRLYETMVAWETIESDEPEERDYAQIWRAAEKVVFSHSLEQVASKRTRIERNLDPTAIRHLKAVNERNISIGGPGLAADAIRAGLVDDYHLLMNPVLVGGGTRALPEGVRLDLELVGERRFA